MKTYDTVIAGGGVSGLTAALLLARAGRSVCVLEQRTRIAPVVRGFSRAGHYFDTGLHYLGSLGEGQACRQLLEQLGLWDALRAVRYDREAFDIYRDSDRDAEPFGFPQGYEALADALKGRFPDQADGIDAYVRTVGDIWRAVSRKMLSGSYQASEEALRFQYVTLKDFLDRHITDASLRRLLTCHKVLYGVEPERVSIFHHAVNVGSYYESAWKLDDGGLALVAALTDRLDALGVELRTGAKVVRLVRGEGRRIVAADLADGERIGFDACIFSGIPSQLPDLLDEGLLRPSFRRTLTGREETSSAFTLYLDGPDDDMLADSNWLIDGFDPMAAHAPSFLSRSHSEGRPGGISVIVPCLETPPEDQAAYRRWKDARVERLYRKTVETLGVEASRIPLAEAATPRTYRDYLGNRTGGLYGLKHCAGGTELMARTSIAGLLLTGQGTLSSGIFGAIFSAMVTTRHMLG